MDISSCVPGARVIVRGELMVSDDAESDVSASGVVLVVGVELSLLHAAMSRPIGVSDAMVARVDLVWRWLRRM